MTVLTGLVRASPAGRRMRAFAGKRAGVTYDAMRALLYLVHTYCGACEMRTSNESRMHMSFDIPHMLRGG